MLVFDSLKLSQPHYVANVVYRNEFFQNLVYWPVGTTAETKTSWIRRSVTLGKMAWGEGESHSTGQDNGCAGRESSKTPSEHKTRQPTSGCEPQTFHKKKYMNNNSRRTCWRYKQELELTNKMRSRRYQLQFPGGCCGDVKRHKPNPAGYRMSLNRVNYTDFTQRSLRTPSERPFLTLRIIPFPELPYVVYPR
jgi:hypothetical protein